MPKVSVRRQTARRVQSQQGTAYAAGSLTLLDQLRRDAPGQWTDNRLEQTGHFHGVIYVAIKAIMNGIYGATIQLNKKHRRYHDVSLRREEKSYFTKALPTAYANASDDQFRPFDDPDHSLVKLLDRPNRTDTFNELLAQLVMQYMLTGSGMMWANPNKLGLPAELYVLPTALCYAQPVSPQYPEGWWRVAQYYTAGGYGILPSPMSGGGAPVDGRDMLVFKEPHPLYRYDAYSALTAGNVQLDILEAIDMARWTAMDQGLTPDMVALVPGWSQSQCDAFLERVKQNNAGKRNHRKAMVIGGDFPDHKPDVKYPNVSAKDMDFAAGWDQMTAFALALFGVPKSVAGLATTGSYAELYAALKQFHTLSLRPLVARLGVWLTRHLARIWGPDLAIQLDLPTIDDQQLLEQQLSTDLAHDGLTYNEYRALRGRSPVPGGDVIKSVYVAQQQAKLQQEQAAQSPPPQPDASSPNGGSPAPQPGESPPAQPAQAAQAPAAVPAPTSPDDADPLASLLGTAQPGSDEGHVHNAIGQAALQALGVPSSLAPSQSGIQKGYAPRYTKANGPRKRTTPGTVGVGGTPVGTKTGSSPSQPATPTPSTSSTLPKEHLDDLGQGEVRAGAPTGTLVTKNPSGDVVPAPEPKPTNAPIRASKPTGKPPRPVPPQSPAEPSNAITTTDRTDYAGIADAVRGGNNFVLVSSPDGQTHEITDAASVKRFVQSGGVFTGVHGDSVRAAGHPAALTDRPTSPITSAARSPVAAAPSAPAAPTPSVPAPVATPQTAPPPVADRDTIIALANGKQYLPAHLFAPHVPPIPDTPAARKALTDVGAWAGNVAEQHVDAVVNHFGIDRDKAFNLLHRAIRDIVGHAALKQSIDPSASPDTNTTITNKKTGESLNLRFHPRTQAALKLVSDTLAHLHGGHDLTPQEAAQFVQSHARIPSSELAKVANTATSGASLDDMRQVKKATKHAATVLASAPAGPGKPPANLYAPPIPTATPSPSPTPPPVPEQPSLAEPEGASIPSGPIRASKPGGAPRPVLPPPATSLPNEESAAPPARSAPQPPPLPPTALGVGKPIPPAPHVVDALDRADKAGNIRALADAAILRHRQFVPTADKPRPQDTVSNPEVAKWGANLERLGIPLDGTAYHDFHDLAATVAGTHDGARVTQEFVNEHPVGKHLLQRAKRAGHVATPLPNGDLDISRPLTPRQIHSQLVRYDKGANLSTVDKAKLASAVARMSPADTIALASAITGKYNKFRRKDEAVRAIHKFLRVAPPDDPIAAIRRKLTARGAPWAGRENAVAQAPLQQPARRSGDIVAPRSATFPVHPDTGLVHRARVGVPAHEVPSTEDEIPRLPNLSDKQRAVESSFARDYAADPDGMADRYLKALRKGKVGVAPNVFGTDDVKMLNRDWNPGKVKPGEPLDKDTQKAMARYNTAVHNTANAIAKRAFLKHLDEHVSKLPPDKRTVLVMNGGVAGGKGSSLARAADPSSPYHGLIPAAHQVGAVWDAAGENNTIENEWIHREAKKRGITPIFAYVHADPKDTWEAPDRGVIRRAVRKGRMVDARLFADSYAEGAKNMHAFWQKHKGDGTKFVFLDNRKKGAPRLHASFPTETLKWDAEQIYRDAMANLEKNKDKLPKALYKAGTAGAKIWGPPQPTT